MKTIYAQEGKISPERLPPSGSLAAVPLLEYGGLKPILPFSEGRSDAACRVVISPSRLPPMGAYGHYHGTGREGTRGWAGESSRKPRRPRPYSRAFAGKTLRGMALPDIYAHAGINGKRREGGNRRGTLRRYVLRGTGESVLNRRIPKGGSRQKAREVQSFLKGSLPSCE